MEFSPPPALLDATHREMRDVLDAVPLSADLFGIMLRYPLGWVNADGTTSDVGSGKMVRPLLVLMCAQASGGDWRRAVPSAAAIEILHNFSLVHDDIEDDSPLRRGRPTVWKQWGMAQAINIGDALFTMAYQAMQRTSLYTEPQITLDALQAFSTTALHLTQGQHLDMRFETLQKVSVDEYITMITGKTAALLGLSAYLGALTASGDRAKADVYHRFGSNIGIAFQIHDDILGIWGDPAVTGKSAASDILTRKKSYPVLSALGLSASLQARFDDDSPITEAEIPALIAEIERTGALEATRSAEQRYTQAALDALADAHPVEPAATALQSLLDALFERQA